LSCWQAASVAFSPTGVLAYIPGSSNFNVGLAARDGALRSLRFPPKFYSYPRISPDGQQLAVQVDELNGSAIYVHL